MPEQKLNEYVAVITRRTENKRYLVNMTLADGMSNAIGCGVAGLSLPVANPIILGIYSMNPGNIGAILEQCERGIIAWRVFEDARKFNQLCKDYAEQYRAVSSPMVGDGRGDRCHLTFRQEALEKLLTDTIFQVPKIGDDPRDLTGVFKGEHTDLPGELQDDR